MIFTRHACERYRQFHMLEHPTANDEDARTILESNAATATKLGHRTYRDDPVWVIEALGVELVVKHEHGVNVCVTVLPPPRFRGLTPLQAEAVAESLERTKAQAAEIRAKRAEETSAMSRTPQESAAKIHKIKRHLREIDAERAILTSALKTMRTQLHADQNLRNLQIALKIVLRHLHATDDPAATEVLQEVRAIDPGFVTGDFIYASADQNSGTPQPVEVPCSEQNAWRP